MKRPPAERNAPPPDRHPGLSSDPPPGLIAYELSSGQVLFVHALPSLPEVAELTATEREILVLVLGGHSTAAIARARGTSPKTTANQVAMVFRKMNVCSRAELAAKVFA